MIQIKGYIEDVPEDKTDKLLDDMITLIESYNGSFFSVTTVVQQQGDTMSQEIRQLLLNSRSMIDKALELMEEPEPSILQVFSPEPESKWNVGKIRQMLTQGFTPQELKSFCFDSADFKDVYHTLGNDTGKAEVVQRLIDHGTRYVVMGVLLGWCKANNPNVYERFGPFNV